MQKLLILVGLPGAGKSTFAIEYLKRNKNTLRVCRDDLRMMLTNGEYSFENEDFVVQQEKMIIQMALLNGNDVIIDDTNLKEKTMQMWQELVETHNQMKHLCNEDKTVEIEIKKFTTSLEECIRRDANRKGKAQVGKGVIMKFYNDYKNVLYPETNKS